MRLIDADKLKRKAQKLSTEAWKTNRVARVTKILNQFIDWIEGMPTIDAVEVVRCKDCKHSDTTDVYVEDVVYCKWVHTSCVKNGYCHRGEREEDGE